MIRYAPIRLPAIALDRADKRSAAGQSSRKVVAPSKLDSSDSISARRESSAPQAWRKKSLRSSGFRSRADVNSSFTWSQFSGMFLVAFAQLARKPCFCQVPVALNGRPGHSQNAGRLLDA